MPNDDKDKDKRDERDSDKREKSKVVEGVGKAKGKEGAEPAPPKDPFTNPILVEPPSGPPAYRPDENSNMAALGALKPDPPAGEAQTTVDLESTTVDLQTTTLVNPVPQLTTAQDAKRDFIKRIDDAIQRPREDEREARRDARQERRDERQENRPDRP